MMLLLFNLLISLKSRIMSERIQKVLSRMGLGSRRQIEAWIAAGRITVNGLVAAIGMPLIGDEQLTLDGKPIRLQNRAQRAEVLAYFKPTGVVTTAYDPEGRPTIFDDLPTRRNGRWIAVGRLDINTQGLLLVTNDGELAHRLMHPSSEVEREYAVRVLGEVSPEVLDTLQKGVELEDGFAQFDQIWSAGGEGANSWYHVVLREGRNREVRRLWESQGITVSRLIRVRYGTANLPRNVRAGRWQALTEAELNALYQLVNLPYVQQAESVSTERDFKFKQVRDDRRDAPRADYARSAPARDDRRSSDPRSRPPRSDAPYARDNRRDAPRTDYARSAPACDDRRSSDPRSRPPRGDAPYARDDRRDSPRADSARSAPARDDRRSSDPRNRPPRSDAPYARDDRRDAPRADSARSALARDDRRSSDPRSCPPRGDAPYARDDRRDAPRTDSARSAPARDDRRSNDSRSRPPRGDAPYARDDRRDAPRADYARSAPARDDRRSSDPRGRPPRNDAPRGRR